jgi:hypothetical protein
VVYFHVLLQVYEVSVFVKLGAANAYEEYKPGFVDAINSTDSVILDFL